MIRAFLPRYLYRLHPLPSYLSKNRRRSRVPIHPAPAPVPTSTSTSTSPPTQPELEQEQDQKEEQTGTFDILPATLSDIEPLIELWLLSVEKDPIYPYLYKDLSWEETVEYEASGPKRVLLKQEWVKYHKVVERESGKIVGFSGWHFPRPLSEEEKTEIDPDYFDPVPEGPNKELRDEWFDRVEEVEFEYLDREKDFFINYLAIHPSYQRLGLGTKLMNIGLLEADKTGARVFLIAFERGVELYKKLGFCEIDSFMTDPRPYGGEKVARSVCMRREASTPEEIGDGEGEGGEEKGEEAVNEKVEGKRYMTPEIEKIARETRVVEVRDERKDRWIWEETKLKIEIGRNG